jgi:hypothetical protein
MPQRPPVKIVDDRGWEPETYGPPLPKPPTKPPKPKGK